MSTWYSSSVVEPGLTLVTEPAVHDYFRANVFVLNGRDRNLVVDAGMGLVPLRPALPLDPDRPVIAVATHIHLDHVGGLHEFDERAGPRVSAAGFATMPDALTYAGMFRGFPGAVTRPPFPGWRSEDYRLEPAPLGRALVAGDVVDLGDRSFTVLSLPGHAPDSIGLFDEADGLFFCGDAIYPGGLIDDLPDSDRAAYRATMRLILSLPIRLACGGHGNVMDPETVRMIADDYLHATDRRR
ncbi:MBL fold metallo-hydrolase [Aquibium carbonis]|uniref:MBL fold metallo-hydrolase n=2 Tax=Aquibium carbonis TaxID=2495581 RepID=A0A429YSH6_9HYPH|nr:MBL fold metallo-hydrolase [Aquibium carbonis]RST84378.1 MBL fold metallo-hydrolase [Aquibium carbonis]